MARSQPLAVLRDRGFALRGSESPTRFQFTSESQPRVKFVPVLYRLFTTAARYFVRQYLTNFGLGLGSLERHRRKRPVFLEKSGSVSLSIRQTLTGCAFDGKVCAFPVIEA